MSIMTENEKTQLKFIVKSLLISTPRKITVDELFSDYAKQEGHPFPFRKFGFSTFIDFLLSIPDTVTVCTRNPRFVTPVINENVKHINDLVSKQKTAPKRGLFHKNIIQANKSWRNAPCPVPLSEISFIPTWATKTSKYTNASQSLYKQDSDKPLKASFLELNRITNWRKSYGPTNAAKFPYKQFPASFLESNRITNRRRSYGPTNAAKSPYEQFPGYEYKIETQSLGTHAPEESIPASSVEMNHMTNRTRKTSETTNVKKSSYKQFPVNEYKAETQLLGTHAPEESIPASLVESNHITNWTRKPSGTINAKKSSYKQFPVHEYQMEIQSLDSQTLDKSLSDHECPNRGEGPATSLKPDQDSSNIQVPNNLTHSLECTSVQNNRNLYHDLITTEHSKIMLQKCNGTYESAKDVLENVDTCTSSGVSSGSSTSSRMFSERALNNMRTLIKQNPLGIWCSEFPDRYKETFGVILEYRLYGYVSMVAVASAYPDIFHCVRQNSSDFVLFDAEQPLPEHYTRNQYFDSYCPVVTNLFRNNLQRMLVNFPCGLKSSKLWEMYYKYFDQNITAHNFGFPNTEHLLQKLQEEEALDLQQVGEDLMIYPHTSYLNQDEPALPHSQLPHLEVMAQEDIVLLESLYPYEVVQWTHTIPQQKWLVEQTHVSVLISEVCSPSKFYLILDGDPYYSALDSLMAEIQEFYVIEGDKYIMPKCTIREGHFCACPYNDEWHRARIRKTWPGKQKVEVAFIDFGTIGEVDLNQLRFLHIDFAKLPIQAIKASLANIKPFLAKNWNAEGSKLFLDVVFGRPLIAELEKIMEDGTVSVALVDTTGDDDIHINDLLVAEGYADFEKVFFPPTSPSLSGNPLMSEDFLMATEFQINTCSRNSSPSQVKGAGRGKVYLESFSKRSDYVGIKSVNKNASQETYASICKSVNITDSKDYTSLENFSKSVIGNSIVLKTNNMDCSSNSNKVSYMPTHTSVTKATDFPADTSSKATTPPLNCNKVSYMPTHTSITKATYFPADTSSKVMTPPLNCNNISYMPTHTSVTKATDFPADISSEAKTPPLKSIWCNPVSSSTTNFSTTHPDFSTTNKSIPIPEVQITPNTNVNQIDYSKSWNQVVSQPLGSNNSITSSVAPGLGWEGMSSSPLNTNSDPLCMVSPQVIEALRKVVLQQQQDFLKSVMTGLMLEIFNKEVIFSQNPNILPSDKPSANISEIVTNRSLNNEIIDPSVTVNDDQESSNSGEIKSSGFQSKENINGEIIVTGIDTNLDKNVHEKVHMACTENDERVQFMRESCTEKILSNQLTDISEKFSHNLLLEDQSTNQYIKDKYQNKRKETSNENMLTVGVTADKGTLKMEQQIVCHDEKQDHSKSKGYFTNKNSSSKDTIKPTRVIKKILIGDKFLNLINYNNEPYFCADEVICTFTKLSGTHVALKILGQNKSITFVEACRDEDADLFKVLDCCDIYASCRKPNGKVHNILYLISLETTMKLLKILKVSNETVLSEIEEEIRLFNPYDVYWFRTPTHT